MKTIFGLVAASALVLAACNSSADEAATTTEASAESTASAASAETPAASGTIVEVAQGNADFSTLVSAVQAAGLVETLNGAGPFTVFAPTNAAFEKIPAETLQGLLTPEQRDTLTAVLTYHVVSGRVDAATLIEQIQAGGGSATSITRSCGCTRWRSSPSRPSTVRPPASGPTSRSAATCASACTAAGCSCRQRVSGCTTTLTACAAT